MSHETIETCFIRHEETIMQSSDQWYMRLLEAMTSAQSQLLQDLETSKLFDELLSALLELSESEYGFIGETHYDDSGQIFLRTHAITNIAWNDYTRKYYEENATEGLEFTNLKTLFGEVLTSGEAVIANTPDSDPRRGGLPLGHPALDSFLGIPLHTAGRMIGMAGVANRPGGYSKELINELSPFLQTCANAIFAFQSDKERKLAEGALSNERNRLRAILDSAYEAIITIDEKGIIESCNQRVSEMFGHSHDFLSGQNVSVLMPPLYASEHDSYIEQYCKTGRAKVIGAGREVLGRRRNGEEFPIHLTITEVNVGNQRLFTGLIRDLSERQETDQRLKQLQAELDRNRFGQLIGRSKPMRKMYSTIGDIAKGDWTVLIEGETGTGKELVARSIHAASARNNGPFIAVNCAALTDSLMSSQLFGHRRGAFTGAIKDQTGFFEAADGGTLFLDEIGDISEELQTSLLRVLEEAEIVPVGDTKARKINTRVIAATNRNLSEDVRTGRFREDLLYRLRIARIIVPPLRERAEDLVLLAEAFLAEVRVATGKAITELSSSAISSLKAYSWPGNVRELKSAIQFSAIHCRTGSIETDDLPPELHGQNFLSSPLEPEELSSPKQIINALENANGNRTKAARSLGISRATLYRKMQAFGIS